jgi:hypothetical protein
MPRPGQLNPRSVGATLLEPSVDGRRVLVKVSWYSGVEPCNVLDSIKVDRGGNEFVLTIIEGSGDMNAVCIEIALYKAAIVDLGGSAGRVHHPHPRARRRRITVTVFDRRCQPSAAARRRRRIGLEPVPTLEPARPSPGEPLRPHRGRARCHRDDGRLPIEALPQLAGLFGALSGGVLALLLLPYVEAPLADVDPPLRAFVVLAGILFIIGVGEAVGSAFGRVVASRLGEGLFGAVDRMLGAVVGSIQALLIVWLAGGFLAAGPSPGSLAGPTSFLVRASMTSCLRHDRAGSSPSSRQRPAGSLHRARALRHRRSRLRRPDRPELRSRDPEHRQGHGIGHAIPSGTASSSRWLRRHERSVVAGSTTVRVTLATTSTRSVLPDPELTSPSFTCSPRRAIDLATVDPTRGATGTFGSCGRLDVQPAAVAGAYDARGRDIYGERQ